MAKLTKDQAKLLTDPNLAAVATIREDGTPQLTPTWVDWDGEHVLVNTGEGRAKPRNIRRDPRVTVLVMDPGDPGNWVSITGTAELTHDGAEEHIEKLAQEYTGNVFSAPKDPQRVLAKITPERVNGPS